MNTTFLFSKHVLATVSIALAITFIVFASTPWFNNTVITALSACTTAAGVKCPPGTARTSCAPDSSVDIAKYGDGNCHCNNGQSGSCGNSDSKVGGSSSSTATNQCANVQNQIQQLQAEYQQLQVQYASSTQNLAQARADLTTYSSAYSSGLASSSSTNYGY